MSKLPSITQALADAITEAQREAEDKRQYTPVGQDNGGLAPLGTRRSVAETYADAGSRDLHVMLVGGPAARELYLAFVQAGADVPPTVVTADVILGDGRVDVMAETSSVIDDRPETWTATLGSGLGVAHAGTKQWSWQRC